MLLTSFSVCFAETEGATEPKKVNIIIDIGDEFKEFSKDEDRKGKLEYDRVPVYFGFRIFNLTTSGSGADMKYGYSVNEKFRGVLTTVTGKEDDDEIISYVEEQTGDKARIFADSLYKEIIKFENDAYNEVVVSQLNDAEDGVLFKDVPQGYYLISNVTSILYDAEGYHWKTFLELLKKEKDGTLTTDDKTDLENTLREWSDVYVASNNKGYSLTMLKTAGENEVTIKSKQSYPELEKFTKEKNDSDNTETGLSVKKADYDIGDEIDFKIVCTIPEAYKLYDAYKYIIMDEISESLDIVKDSWDVNIEGPHATNLKKDFKLCDLQEKEYKEDLELQRQYPHDYHIIAGSKRYAFVPSKQNYDLKQVTKGTELTKEDRIVVTYKAKLNDKAVTQWYDDVMTGSRYMNGNIAQLRYSSNPYEEHGRITDVTPPDIVHIFTYSVEFTKWGKAGDEKKKIEGAKFKLYKNINGKYETEVPAEPLTNLTEDYQYKFHFRGLDAGKYKLVETEAPKGFSKHRDIYFEITSDAQTTEDPYKLNVECKEINKDGTPYSGDAPVEFVSKPDSYTMALAEKLTGHKPPKSFKSGPSSRGLGGGGEVPIKENLKDIAEDEGTSGMVAADVVDITRKELPSTGGMGKKLFYLAGALLVTASGVLLYNRRRMAQPVEDDDFM